MDLLVLADQTGAVDMTYEAISRRTNVPVEEVVKYVKQLCQPDARSRSPLEEGKRLIPLDSNRDWGWQIVNYVHYRNIRDEAARREYFRDKQREHRKKNKKQVFDGEGVSTPSNFVKDLSASASSCTLVLKEGVRGRFTEWMEFRKAMGHKPKSWPKMFEEQAKWLADFTEAEQLEIISASMRNNWRGLFAPKQPKGNNLPKKASYGEKPVPERLKSWAAEKWPVQREYVMAWQIWKDVPAYIRDEWFRENRKWE